MTRLGMLIETDRCLGCGICVRACKDEFEGTDHPPYSASQPEASYGWGPRESYGWPETPSSATPWVSHGHLWMKVEELVDGSFPDPVVRYLPMPCMHCQAAPCVEAGKNGAVTTRSDGVVLIDPLKSRGQDLTSACPYGRIEWNAVKGISQKCTFCAHLLESGGEPRCAEACPVSAITVGDLEDPDSEVSGKIRMLGARPLRPELGTGPAVFYAGLPEMVPGVTDTDG